MDELKLYDVISKGADKMDVDYEDPALWCKLGFMRGLSFNLYNEVSKMYAQVAYTQLMEELDVDKDKPVDAKTLFPFFVARNAVCMKHAIDKLVENPSAMIKAANEYTENNEVTWENAVGESINAVFTEILKFIPKVQ